MFTQVDVDNLKRAVVSGVRSVTINGKSVTYASTAELIAALSLAQAEVNASVGDSVSYASYSKD